MVKRSSSKKFPSRIKYEKTHPVVSARLPIEDHKKLKEFLKIKNLSLAKFLKGVIKGSIGSYEEGYRKCTQDWQIWYFCSDCGGKIVIKPKDPSHVYILKDFHKKGWRHVKCPMFQNENILLKKSSGTMVKLKKR